MNRVEKFIYDDSGQDLTEYGLLAAFISIAAVVAAQNLGPQAFALYRRIHNSLSRFL